MATPSSLQIDMKHTVYHSLFFIITAIMTTVLLDSCSDDGFYYGKRGSYDQFSDSAAAREYIIVLNEGNWQSDNGKLSLIKDHKIFNNWFRGVNGFKIGDTPEDIIYIPERDMVAVSVNWSNIIYYMDRDGKVLAQTEDIPNCRAMCTDGTYIYITSYAHQTALGETYQRGYVAKVRLSDYKIIKTCEVGYEPEGIAYYKGKLFVANTGGYAFAEKHDYEHSVSVLDTAMVVDTIVDIRNSAGEFVINLYGEMSQSGEYLCINSPGDYYDTPPATVIFNCQDFSYKVFDSIPATYNTTLLSGKFFVVGSTFSYYTGGYKYNIATIDPTTGLKYDNLYELPGGSMISTPLSIIETMQNPYCVYQNPYTGHLYIADADTYASDGHIVELDEDGFEVGKRMRCYINPGHMIALPPRK